MKKADKTLGRDGNLATARDWNLTTIQGNLDSPATVASMFDGRAA